MMRRHRTIRTAARRWLRGCAALAIAVQMLVPTGYMPGQLAAGTPFVLCDAQLARHAMPTAAAATSAHGHADSAAAHHSHSPDSEHATGDATHDDHVGSEAWEHCPLGALGASAALASAFSPAIAPPIPDHITPQETARPISTSRLPARARAPPA